MNLSSFMRLDDFNELERIMKSAPVGIILPKCESGAGVQQLGARLAVLEAEYGLVDGTTKIIGIIETATSLLHLSSYVGCSTRLVALMFNTEAILAAVGKQACDLSNGLVRIACVAAKIEVIKG
jgi:citrate lyase subunit beta / citryl-CoA lyase